MTKVGSNFYYYANDVAPVFLLVYQLMTSCRFDYYGSKLLVSYLKKTSLVPYNLVIVLFSPMSMFVLKRNLK